MSEIKQKTVEEQACKLNLDNYRSISQKNLKLWSDENKMNAVIKLQQIKSKFSRRQDKAQLSQEIINYLIPERTLKKEIYKEQAKNKVPITPKRSVPVFHTHSTSIIPKPND